MQHPPNSRTQLASHRELLSPLTRKLFGTQCTWRLADVDAHKMPNAVKDVDGGARASARASAGPGAGAPPTLDTASVAGIFQLTPLAPLSTAHFRLRKSHQAIFLRTLTSGSGIMRFGN